MRTLQGSTLALVAALAVTSVGCVGDDETEWPSDRRAAATAEAQAEAAREATTSAAPAAAPADTGADHARFDLGAPTLGTNLVAVSYYSPQRPFVDVMKSSQVLARGFPWHLSSGTPPPVDPQGYPVGLAPGQVATTYALRGVDGLYPTGAYVVLFEGDGEVELSWDGGKASHRHGGVGTARFVASVTETSHNGLAIKIKRSSPANHVRNVRVIMPGFEGSHEKQPFHPLFLERLAPFTVLRFMDWGATNDSEVREWSERKRPDYRSMHGRGGVAYEVMADLCNQTGKHMWVCVPHQATDDYVRRLAALLRERLDPSLKLFVEYSNEVWNGGFDQHEDVKAMARAQGLTWYAFYARRSVEIFEIFEQELGGRSRLVRVLGSQHANPWIGKQILAAVPAGAADALAIAPYFGHAFGKPSTAATVRAWSVDELLARCAEDIAKQRELMRKNRAVADAAGLKLIAYEGGQHLAPVGRAVDDTQLVELFVAANRHPRMYQLYMDYFAAWRAEGGGTFVHFTDVYVPQKWGCWGALEHPEHAPSTAPKYRALLATAAAWAQDP